MRIICLFNLKPGATAAAYEAWARDTDMPAVGALASVKGFSVHRATGLFGSDARPPFDYIEVIDIHGMDEFVVDVSNPDFQAVAAGLHAFTDNPVFIVTEDL
jgi:hypothetical protein